MYFKFDNSSIQLKTYLLVPYLMRATANANNDSPQLKMENSTHRYHQVTHLLLNRKRKLSKRQTPPFHCWPPSVTWTSDMASLAGGAGGTPESVMRDHVEHGKVHPLTPGLFSEGWLVISPRLRLPIVEAIQLRRVQRERLGLSGDQAIRDTQAAQAGLHWGQVIL